MSQPTNPLVASPQDDTTAITGIGIAESAADAYHGIVIRAGSRPGWVWPEPASRSSAW